MEKAKKAEIVLFLLDANINIESQLTNLSKVKHNIKEKLLIVVNKIDLNPIKKDSLRNPIFISAKNNQGIDLLKKKLLTFVNTEELSSDKTTVTNLRHYEELKLTLNEINIIIKDLNKGVSGDFLAINIRQALHHLGSITGEITNDTLLGNIFGKFCIGK
jgi:tRNA modification GTPase